MAALLGPEDRHGARAMRGLPLPRHVDFACIPRVHQTASAMQYMEPGWTF
jgi:hypothetical protein